MPLIDCVQGSPEWLQWRCGMITGSRMDDVLSVLMRGGGETQKRFEYKVQLVAERLTRRAAEHYVSPEMEWGIANEPLARGAYEALTGQFVETTGFWVHDELAYFGASPDALVGKDGVLEIKCPKTSTHIKYLLAKEVPAEYEPQMAAELACTGRQWCDFVSFDPRLPEGLQLFIVRYERNQERMGEIADAAAQMEQEIQAMIERLGVKPKAETKPAPLEGGLTDEDLELLR